MNSKVFLLCVLFGIAFGGVVKHDVESSGSASNVIPEGMTIASTEASNGTSTSTSTMEEVTTFTNSTGEPPCNHSITSNLALFNGNRDEPLADQAQETEQNDSENEVSSASETTIKAGTTSETLNGTQIQVTTTQEVENSSQSVETEGPTTEVPSSTTLPRTTPTPPSTTDAPTAVATDAQTSTEPHLSVTQYLNL